MANVQTRVQLLKLVSYLRNQTYEDRNKVRQSLSVHYIARLLGASSFCVRRLISQAEPEADKENRCLRLQDLTADQMKFLTDARTLKEQRPLSLRQRCLLFAQKFGSQQISIATLRQLYRQNKISLRKI